MNNSPINSTINSTTAVELADGSSQNIYLDVHRNIEFHRSETCLLSRPYYMIKIIFFRNDVSKVTNMVLAFMNEIQAIYHFKRRVSEF